MAYKVEFAKFNIMSNLNGGVNGSDSGIMPPLSTVPTTSGPNDLHQIHHQMISNDANGTTTPSYVDEYSQRNEYTDVSYNTSHHNQFPSNMYGHHHQGSPTYHQQQQQLQQSYSPLSNTSSTTNEQQSNYQQQQQQTDISNSSPLSHHPYHSDVDESNATEESPYLVTKTSTVNQQAAQSVYYHYPDSLHYNMFQITNNHSYYNQQHYLNPPPVYQATQYGSMYDTTAARYPSSPPPMFHNQQLTDMSSSTTTNLQSTSTTSASPVCREMHTDVTGVVYTTLTDCRYAGDDNQTLNLPNQYNSSSSL